MRKERERERERDSVIKSEKKLELRKQGRDNRYRWDN